MVELPERGSHDSLIVIGGSAGAIEPLGQLLSNLPSDLPAAVIVVVHMLPTGHSVLPQILSRKSGWSVLAAVDGEELQSGRAYVAVPDHHLLIDSARRVRVVKGPKENGHRPAVDPLFRSAANSGAPVVGVVLSGGLDDGAAGAAMIRRRGGLVLVQDRDQAPVSDMPRNAMDAAGADAELPAPELGKWITQRLQDGSQPSDPPAEPSFDLPAAIDDEALWTALRTVDDQIAIDQRLLQRSHDAGRPSAARVIRERLEAEEDASRALWQLLTGGIADRPSGSRVGPPRSDEIDAASGNRLN